MGSGKSKVHDEPPISDGSDGKPPVEFGMICYESRSKVVVSLITMILEMMTL